MMEGLCGASLQTFYWSREDFILEIPGNVKTGLRDASATILYTLVVSSVLSLLFFLFFFCNLLAPGFSSFVVCSLFLFLCNIFLFSIFF